ncbi:MAG: prepilin peptidase [Intrasporangium sp.]|uniref:prepilin peptidase n=1 Tax=Intrasporangium sp. TaxID=1925024 RepID=UPI002649D9A6|nr:prepilin peptidase [Intrasporangium sp.]MDN5797922.1 prepilin peptidase [Intrasporangium sp.]
MPEPSVLLGAAFVGLVAGAVLQSQLVHLRYRLEDERRLPKRSAVWVIPATIVLTVLIWAILAPGHPPIVPTTYVVASWTIVALAFIDLDVHRLPDHIQLPSYPILAVLLFGCSYLTGDWGALLRAGICGAGLWLFYFLLIFALPPGSIGFGDVKLAGLLGLLLGWLGWGHVAIATIVAFVVAGVLAAALLMSRRKDRGGFAYGPSMLLGAAVALISPLLLRWLQ